MVNVSENILHPCEICEHGDGAEKEYLRLKNKLKIYKDALKIVKENCLNPAHTMTKLGLEGVVDSNFKLATKVLNDDV